MKSLRQDVIGYIRKTYKDEIEHPWMRYPDYGVFRHKDNQKWYGLMMDVPRAKLGLKGDSIVDILNIKLGDFLMRDFLIQREGFFPGYHIARGNWISILLDGTVDLAKVCHLIDVSYQVTASAKTKKAIRPPKEWLFLIGMITGQKIPLTFSRISGSGLMRDKTQQWDTTPDRI